MQELIANKNSNNVYLSKSAYSEILEEMETAKSKKCYKSALDYQRLKRYDVLNVGAESKLIGPLLKEDAKIKYFVSCDQLFDIIHNSHLSTGHGGRKKMLKDLNEKYKNVTVESIMLYLSLCRACQQNTKGKRKNVVGKSILANELHSRCLVDVIDLQMFPDNDYKFVLNYQDYLTNFVVLRPLKTKTSSEIAEYLLDIFALLGAPSVLQCEDREFSNKIVTELTNAWDGIKTVHGKHRYPQASQDIRKMLFTWLSENDTTKWSEGLKFVQLRKNNTFDERVKQSPYEALFGRKMKLGLKSTNLPEELMNRIQNEEQLEKAIKGIDVYLEFGGSSKGPRT